ncbi:MAG: hypothetical protein K1W35_13025 [Lachnospiraceae bacterium]
MYIVIGKIETQDGNRTKLDACRIIDTDTREVKDISIVKIKNAIINGVQVIGFKAIHSVKANKDNVAIGTRVSKSQTSNFRWKKVPRLTGNGELIDIEDAKYITVIGWSGFAEMKTYYLINWQGKEIKLNLQELIKKVQADEVNGASYDTKYSRPVMNKELNKELYIKEI